MNLCIFGASSDRLDPCYYDAAEALGGLIARAGHTVVFGGGAGGLMGACARGAQKAGGRLIGIAPKLFDEPGFLLSGCTELILTDTMAGRKEKMLALSDAFLALPGGIGTMDEFFEALTLRQLGLLDGNLVLLNTAGFYDALEAFLHQMADQGFMSRNCLSLLRICPTPEAALEAALERKGPRGSIRRLEDYTR
ncbi:MAG: TIGR00730 family Rossman fold protein [Oscillospiraceae bacterium]|nr:TIGR00730 family Rossman fold protein [Oscillospiraceae bacterium]